MTGDFDVDGWIDALVERHAASMRRPELLKAIRALSARYVERRAELPGRSPLDSDGKRAAFAIFYAPIHFVTTRGIIRQLAGAGQVRAIADLGCGTGAAGAAWALETRHRAPRPDTATADPDERRVVQLVGVDASAWAVSEANWSWQRMALRGRARRGDLVATALDLAFSGREHGATTAIILGWAVNELDSEARARLLPALINRGRQGAPVLIIEPIARRLIPWWDDWARAVEAAGGHAAEWRLAEPIPSRLANLDEAAGFQRDALTARTLSFALGPP